MLINFFNKEEYLLLYAASFLAKRCKTVYRFYGENSMSYMIKDSSSSI